MVAENADLKRLDFVKNYSEYYLASAYGLASGLYSTTRSYAPSYLEPRLQAVEAQVNEYGASFGAPVLTAVQDRGQWALGVVDKKVDGVLGRAEGFVSANSAFLTEQAKKQREYHAKNLQHFADARDQYLQQAKDAVEFVKKEGVSGTVQLAADGVLRTVEEAKKVPGFLGKEAQVLLDRVNEAWVKLASLPAVQKALGAVAPSVELAKKQYIAAHDAVVTAPAYNKVVETGVDVLNKVQTTQVYQSAAMRLHPVISPLTDKVMHNSYYTHLMDHLKPVAAAH